MFRLLIKGSWGSERDSRVWHCILFGPAYSSDEAGDGPSPVYLVHRHILHSFAPLSAR